MPQCMVHNVGFYAPEARAIYSMALNEAENKLAVARSDASIEIWNLSNLPFIDRTIASNLENFSVEGLSWCDNRLFSVGLHGWLVEYDLFRLNVKNKWAVTGEAATCLDAIKPHLAVGTEQGYINIFSLNEDEVRFEKFLDKQEGRIICLKYSSQGDFVAAGSINAIRIWNVKTGHAIHKMVLGQSETKKNTIVWCLEVLDDFSIFSGDSRGILTLWDGKLGAQIESYQSHKADIIAICLDEKKESIYCAGVDPTIANFEKVKVGSNDKWVKSIQRKIHDHDVRAMVFNKGKLYSAGIDSYLVCSYHPPKTLIKYAPILQSPCVEVGKGLILLRYAKRIELWSLGSGQKVSDGYKGAVELKSKPKKLVTIQKLGKNWSEEDEPEAIVCSSVSLNGELIFLATSTGFRLYQFKMVEDKPELTKLDDLDDDNIPCVQGTFNNQYKQLIVALDNGSITIYDWEDGNPFISQRIDKNKEYLSDTVSLLTVSTCGKYFAVADCKSNIVIFAHHQDGYSFKAKLPKYNVPPTALGINSGNVVVVYANNRVVEYDLAHKKFTDLSRKLENSNGWKSKTHPVRTISFDSRDKNVIFLHDDSNVVIINKDGLKSSKTNSKSIKMAKTDKQSPMVNGHASEQLKIKTIQKYKHLVHFLAIQEGEFVAVEANPLSILEQLPPAFAQKTFGSKLLKKDLTSRICRSLSIKTFAVDEVQSIIGAEDEKISLDRKGFSKYFKSYHKLD
ncbi:unnamed protein product [Ceutorhynchus assimilis]|uniref:Uncharacterized protein n=1 Tax=Ceutorhynchus assimilis TaxID=467358 RepID=A0A9N9MVE0_9CUCU|nr:unnamed protein product [Ceutorhynchus assimilis]